MSDLKKKRKQLGLTQKEVAKATGVSRRTYQTYEEQEIVNDTFKRLVKMLDEMGVFDGSNYLLNPKIIMNKSTPVLRKYSEIKAAYIIGSYAEGRATGKDDVDLVIIATPPRLTYVSLIKELEAVLYKKVDLRIQNQLLDNESLLETTLIKGIKIYAKRNYRNR